jgi:surface antigen
MICAKGESFRKISRPYSRMAVVAALVLSFGVAGCASDGSLTPEGRDTLGTLGGAAAGVLLCKFAHANPATCLALAVAGGTAGFVIAKQIDERDREARQAAINRMLAEDAVKQQSWKSAQTGNTGSVTLLSANTNAQGQLCRRFHESYNKAGTPINEDYTMCKGSDGSWATTK